MNYILSNPKLFPFQPRLCTTKRQQGFQEGARRRPPRSDQKPTLGHIPPLASRQRERHSTRPPSLALGKHSGP